MPVYRKLTDLTDEEITFIMKDIFGTDVVQDIVRFMDNYNQIINCDIHISDYEGIAIYDTIILDEVGMDTHDFEISQEENEKYLKFLLAKGVDWRLKDNPYLENVS